VQLTNMPEEVIDWSQAPLFRIPGLTATAMARTHQAGEVRLRIIEYAPGYVADHWCSKGHIIYVIAGELIIDHQNDCPAYALSAGMSWHVADDEGPAHRARSDRGATIFIVD
jgi:quercetin dioxygenase-like cupin family protein